MKLKTNNIFIIVLLVITIVHLIITSLLGHYIATQVGLLTGQVIGEELINASKEPYSSGENVNKIYRNMQVKSNEVISKWKIPSFLISLPIKPILNPLRKLIVETWVAEPVRGHQITLEEVKRRASIIDNVSNGLNSVAFGVLIYLAYSLIVKMRRQQVN